ncbi:hypothetical protein Q3304_08555 [Clostridioides sp. GD02377]|uniref:hypothetical protein n=1 Tax=unclassified Clostridioides TaxID=2635829 RepID=UPI00389C3394
MEEYFIEEWPYMADIGFEIADIENTTIIVNNLKVSMKMSENFAHLGDIECTVEIPYSHEIFTKDYIEEFNIKEPGENDEFNDELSKVRDKIEEGIEDYLKKNKKLIEIDYEM